jgi:hypothetical protein
MSTQSITLLSKEKIIEEAQEILIHNFENYFYHKNFRLGYGIDEEMSMHNMYLKETLCENNCEVYNYFQDKLAGILNCEKEERTLLSKTIVNHNTKQNINIDTRNFWETKMW